MHTYCICIHTTQGSVVYGYTGAAPVGQDAHTRRPDHDVHVPHNKASVSQLLNLTNILSASMSRRSDGQTRMDVDNQEGGAEGGSMHDEYEEEEVDLAQKLAPLSKEQVRHIFMFFVCMCM